MQPNWEITKMAQGDMWKNSDSFFQTMSSNLIFTFVLGLR